jgi:hypothetical protein
MQRSSATRAVKFQAAQVRLFRPSVRSVRRPGRVANEWIGQSCTYQTFVSTNFRCGDTRTALANWYTRITLVG